MTHAGLVAVGRYLVAANLAVVPAVVRWFSGNDQGALMYPTQTSANPAVSKVNSLELHRGFEVGLRREAGPAEPPFDCAEGALLPGKPCAAVLESGVALPLQLAEHTAFGLEMLLAVDAVQLQYRVVVADFCDVVLHVGADARRLLGWLAQFSGLLLIYQ